MQRYVFLTTFAMLDAVFLTTFLIFDAVFPATFVCFYAFFLTSFNLFGVDAAPRCAQSIWRASVSDTFSRKRFRPRYRNDTWAESFCIRRAGYFTVTFFVVPSFIRRMLMSRWSCGSWWPLLFKYHYSNDFVQLLPQANYSHIKSKPKMGCISHIAPQ